VTFFASSETIEIEPVAGWKGEAMHSERMTLVSYVIAAGAPEVHEHHHPEEEAWMVIEGELAVWVGGDERILGPGDVAVIASNAHHRVRALRPSRALVVDAPSRRQLPGAAH
jgi:quercetin dioxygenase-like cupin family protein